MRHLFYSSSSFWTALTLIDCTVNIVGHTEPGTLICIWWCILSCTWLLTGNGWRLRGKRCTWETLCTTVWSASPTLKNSYWSHLLSVRKFWVSACHICSIFLSVWAISMSILYLPNVGGPSTVESLLCALSYTWSAKVSASWFLCSDMWCTMSA